MLLLNKMIFKNVQQILFVVCLKVFIKITCVLIVFVCVHASFMWWISMLLYNRY